MSEKNEHEHRAIVQLSYGAAKVRGVKMPIGHYPTASLIIYQDSSGGSDEAYAPVQQVGVCGLESITKLRDLLTNLLDYLVSEEK